MSVRDRLDRGFVSSGKIVLLLFVFACYTGYKFVPGWMAQNGLESAIERYIFDGDAHHHSDSRLQAEVAKVAGARSVEVEDGQIRVTRDKRPGERLIQVEFEYPTTVSYLGREMTIQRAVHVERAIQVSETAERRREEEIVRKQREDQEYRRRHAERGEAIKRKIDAAMADCEAKHGKGGCELQWQQGGNPDKVIRAY